MKLKYVLFFRCRPYPEATMSNTSSTNGGIEPPPKKPHLEKETKEKENDGSDGEGGLADLSDFQFEKVLSDAADNKRIAVLGKIAGKGDSSEPPQPAVLVIEKLPFAVDQMDQLLAEGGKVTLKRQFNNDVYSMFHGHIDNAKANSVKVNLVWPASQKHIDKFAKAPAYFIDETPAIFNYVTLPFLESQALNIDWVYNLLERKAEAERIIYEDADPETGFILSPDLKWSGQNLEDLYCLAIVHKRGIMSIRDLTADHLPLLRKLYRDAPAAIEAKFGVDRSKLRIYFHYHPTYYHLHVHYTHVDFKAPGSEGEKAHLLKTVIDRLEKAPGLGYARATLPIKVKEGTKLHQAFVDAGFVGAASASEAASAAAVSTDDNEMDKTLEFLRLLGKAKHEPCGEHWSTSYGDGAWRMAVMAICLSTSLDRKHLVKIALSSALTSLGKETDQNSTWADKLKEVRRILSELLPPKLAAKLYDLYVIHVSARRGLPPKNQEEKVYRKLLEMEEALLVWEEFQRENDEKAARRLLLSKMVEAGFPGHEKYTMFGDSADFQSLLTFFITISNLRCLKRTGWVRSGVRDPERVSGHMFRMGVMAMMLESEEEEADSRIFGGTSVVLSIVHDLAECIVGDLTPSDPITPEEKHRQEMEATRTLVRNLPCSTHTKEIFEAFRRYESQEESDAQARLTKSLDKFDMVLQAFEYEVKNLQSSSSSKKKADFLQQFFDSTANAVELSDHPVVKRWNAHLRAVRKEHLEAVAEAAAVAATDDDAAAAAATASAQ